MDPLVLSYSLEGRVPLDDDSEESADPDGGDDTDGDGDDEDDNEGDEVLHGSWIGPSPKPPPAPAPNGSERIVDRTTPHPPHPPPPGYLVRKFENHQIH